MGKSRNKGLPGERSQLALYMSLPILSWAFYDFANTIFSSNITTVFFPFYTNEVLRNK